MTPIPPSPRNRRQLSRSLPWQLPVIGLLVICTVALTLWQPGRASEAGDAAAASVAAVEGVVEGMVESEPVGDPLDDPTIEASALDQSSAINLLVLGTDGRDQQDGPPRTDLIMVIMLNRAPERATVLSIPRDLWVPIDGYGEGKINTAFFLGSLDGDGTILARRTVEDLLGIEIDHALRVDFNGFRKVVDTLGGIAIEVPEAIDDPAFPDGNYGTIHLEIPAGRQVMDGETALQYARTRYGGTDQDRALRQQQVVDALRERAMEPGSLARAPLLIRDLSSEIETDLSLADLFALARLGRGLDRDEISMQVLNGELTWPVLTWNGQDALLYDPEAVRAAVRDWSRSPAAAAPDTPAP